MGTFWKIFADNRDIIMMAPGLFAAAVAVGWFAGWMVIRLVYNQRLAHQQDMITNLRAVLEEKLPASFLSPINQNRAMSLPMISLGLSLIFVGATAVAIGVFWKTPAQKIQPAINQASVTDAIKLFPDDGGAVTWNLGYLLGASGNEGGGIKITTLQLTGQNNSDDFLEPLSGFFRSGITGNRYSILVVDNKGALVSAEGYGIPARHQFNVAAKLSDTGISGMEFLRDFGRMTFEFKYGDHTYKSVLTPEELDDEVRRTENDLRPKPVQGVAGIARKPQ